MRSKNAPEQNTQTPGALVTVPGQRAKVVGEGGPAFGAFSVVFCGLFFARPGVPYGLGQGREDGEIGRRQLGALTGLGEIDGVKGLKTGQRPRGETAHQRGVASPETAAETAV